MKNKSKGFKSAIMITLLGKNLENFVVNSDQVKDTPNPLGNDIFNKKPDEFDTSVFIVEKIQGNGTKNHKKVQKK